MNTAEKQWKLLAHLVKGEHKLWRKSGDPGVYITGDDGDPLKLVGPLKIGRGGPMGVVANVYVQDAMGRHAGYTMLHPLIGIWLIENEGFAAVTTPELRTMAKLIGLAK